MDMETPAHHGGLKKRVLAELKAFWIIALYLWLFLGTFTVYRRLILAETGVAYLNYGVALVEALIIAKVILIGRLFGFSRRFDHMPLIVPVLYKTAFFGLLVFLFGLLERLANGWIHKQGLLAGLHEFIGLGAYELGARTLMLVVALVPFVAFGEIGRVLGADRLAAMFFSKREAPADTKAPAS